MAVLGSSMAMLTATVVPEALTRRLCGARCGYLSLEMNYEADPEAARWEFRCWGSLPGARRRLANLGKPDGADETKDLYLITPDPSANIKISDRELQVKRLLDTDHGFERWTPVWKRVMPLWTQDLARLFREGGVQGPSSESASAEVPLGAGAIEVQFEHLPGCGWLQVFKARQRFEIEGSLAEATQVVFPHRDVSHPSTWSVAVEGTDLDALLHHRERLGIAGERNCPVHVMAAEVAAISEEV